MDVSSIQRGVEQFSARAAAKEKAKTEQEQANIDDIKTNLATMSKVAIMPKDRELIAGKTALVADYVKKNIASLRSGDAVAMMGYQTLAGDLYTSAENSKNFREEFEKQSQVLGKDALLYRPEVLKAHMDRASTADAGNWTPLDPSSYKKNISYGDRVLGELNTYAKTQAAESADKKFTIDEANDLIDKDLLDANYYEQAAYDFNKAEDKKGATTPVEYYHAVYGPLLSKDATKPLRTSDGGGSTTKQPKVNATLKTDSTTGRDEVTFNYADKPENPPLKVIDPNDDTKTIDVIPMSIWRNKEGKVFLQGSVKQYGADGKVTGSKKQDFDYSAVSDVMTNSYGIDNPIELLNGKAPSHVHLVTKGGASKGGGTTTTEKMYIVGGKAYKESALKKQGYDISTLKEYK